MRDSSTDAVIKQLKLIFLDGHIVDIDMSHWDQVIRFCVIGTDAAPSGVKRLPVFDIGFVRVHSLQFRFNHHARKLDEGHYQWRCDAITADVSNGRYHVSLRGSPSGGPQMPVTAIECDDIVIREMSHELLDKTYPRWDAPGSPFIRPPLPTPRAGRRR